MILGKSGYQISEEEAMDYVWGYTIINGTRVRCASSYLDHVANDYADVTARKRQRDHKQFYIGKSADTFCPMVNIRSA